MKKLYAVIKLGLPVVLYILAVITFTGCSQKETVTPKGNSVAPGITCEIVPKLPDNISKPFEVNYGNRIKLLGVTYEKKSTKQILLSYFWQINKDLDIFNYVAIHFTTSESKMLYQGDHTYIGIT